MEKDRNTKNKMEQMIYRNASRTETQYSNAVKAVDAIVAQSRYRATLKMYGWVIWSTPDKILGMSLFRAKNKNEITVITKEKNIFFIGIDFGTAQT